MHTIQALVKYFRLHCVVHGVAEQQQQQNDRARAKNVLVADFMVFGVVLFGLEFRV